MITGRCTRSALSRATSSRSSTYPGNGTTRRLAIVWSVRAEMIGMRALLPEPQPDVDLHQHYARHWLDRGGVGANFISSRADVVICGDDVVDLGAVRAALADRGLTRILCEGGPTLFADLAAAGQVDELCLTLSPLLAGPGAGRITSGASWPLDRVGHSAMSLD